MVHAFSGTGLLTQQYITFSRLARLGAVGKRYIYQSKNGSHFIMYATFYAFVNHVVYGDLHYLDVIHKKAECSMLSSVEVQPLCTTGRGTEINTLIIWHFICMSSSVGHHWCLSWLDSKCIPYHCSLYDWVVSTLYTIWVLYYQKIAVNLCTELTRL